MLTPETTRRAARRAGRDPGRVSTPTAMARLLAAYEEVKAERGVIDFEDVLLLTVGVLRTEPATIAETVRAQYRHFVVDEYQDVNPLQQRLLDLWLGEPRRAVRRRRRQPDDLLVHRRLARATCSSFPARYPGATVVKLVRDYRSTPAGRRPRQRRPARPAPDAGGHRLRAGRPAAGRPGADVRPRTPTSRPRPPASPRASASCSTAGVPAERDRRAVPHQRPVRGLRAGARRRRRPLLVRGGERFFDRPEVREAVLLLRGAAARPTTAERAARPERCATCCRRRAGPTRRPPAGGAVAGALGVAGGARRGSPRTSPRQRPEAGPAPTSSPSSTSGPPPSTRRRSRASRWPRCTRPRAWSGTPSSWSGCVDGTHADQLRRRPRSRSRRSAGCSTSASPGPASTCACPGRGARSPGGPGRAGGPRAFLDGLRAGVGRRRTRRSRPEPAPAGRGASAAVAGRPCRVVRGRRWPPPPNARSAAAPTARRPTTRRSSSALRTWRGAARAARPGPGVRRLHRRHAHRHRRARPSDDAAGHDLRGRGGQAGALRRVGAGHPGRCRPGRGCPNSLCRNAIRGA